MFSLLTERRRTIREKRVGSVGREKQLRLHRALLGLMCKPLYPHARNQIGRRPVSTPNAHR
jgi:hypothetical protein